ncbi:MAG: hypothetical protein NTX00_03730 [Candidatus Parcubacteria bacterium]|nr:hypothetical protein [Candidatus Parcubacteria bacterium]
MKKEFLSKIELKKKSKEEFAKDLIPEIFKLKRETGISMTLAIVETLKKKGITDQGEVNYFKELIPSLAGKKGAWARKKIEVKEIEDYARYQELKKREERKKEEEKSREKDLPLLRSAGLIDENLPTELRGR